MSAGGAATVMWWAALGGIANTLSSDDRFRQKRHHLFDGVYMNSDVWINATIWAIILTVIRRSFLISRPI